MALLQCKECGTSIDSGTRQTRCKNCGTLFPFACAVCDKPLRPPFSVYPDERFLTSDNRPLCEEHYQRQCPECNGWFRADENPGYFRCPACNAAHAAKAQVLAHGAAPDGAQAKAVNQEALEKEALDAVQNAAKGSGCGATVLLFAGVSCGLVEVARYLL